MRSYGPDSSFWELRKASEIARAADTTPALRGLLLEAAGGPRPAIRQWAAAGLTTHALPEDAGAIAALLGPGTSFFGGAPAGR